jgi:hypothetical protein
VSDIKKEHFDTGHVELLSSVARQLGKQIALLTAEEFSLSSVPVQQYRR